VMEDRWWMGMGPGADGPSITVMQPDDAEDEKIWKKFGTYARPPDSAEARHRPLLSRRMDDGRMAAVDLFFFRLSLVLC